jgi:hypothetical protein
VIIIISLYLAIATSYFACDAATVIANSRFIKSMPCFSFNLNATIISFDDEQHRD